jgi:hypothetical protein
VGDGLAEEGFDVGVGLTAEVRHGKAVGGVRGGDERLRGAGSGKGHTPWAYDALTPYYCHDAMTPRASISIFRACGSAFENALRRPTLRGGARHAVAVDVRPEVVRRLL